MTVNEIQELVNQYDYWDLRVLSLECNYFADEIKLVYDDTDGYCVIYNFEGCYKSIFDHVKGYDKLRPVREMVTGQIPYFLQAVDVSETTMDNVHFYIVKINMFPLYLEVWCKDIKVQKEKLEKTRNSKDYVNLQTDVR